MKTKLVGSCMAVCTVSLLFVSCESTNRITSAERRYKRPPAQNVHTYEGGEILARIQSHSGAGFDSSHSGFSRP